MKHLSIKDLNVEIDGKQILKDFKYKHFNVINYNLRLKKFNSFA